MTTTPTAVLAKCFAALPRADLERLAYHLEKRTPICCWRKAYLWTDGEGGG